jgi:hypothetical protein
VHRERLAVVVLGRRHLDVTFVAPRAGAPYIELGSRWAARDEYEGPLPWLDRRQLEALIGALQTARARLGGER